MKKIYKKVDEVKVTKTTTTQAVEVSMQPSELDSIGRLVLTEKQGGIFTPSVDADIQGFKRTMMVVARDNGRVVLVPAHRSPSKARELAKSAHGKVSVMECGDVVVTLRFSSALVGKITKLFEEECLMELAAGIRTWEALGDEYFE